MIHYRTLRALAIMILPAMIGATGCMAEEAAPESSAPAVGALEWREIAPGVEEMTLEDGTVRRRGFGEAGYTWFVAQLRVEQAEIADQLAGSDQEESAILRERGEAVAATLADAERNLAGLRGVAVDAPDTTAFPSAQPLSPAPDDDWDSCSFSGQSCYAYAWAGPDSPGVVDGYASASCSGNAIVSARVYVSSDGYNTGDQTLQGTGSVSRYGAGWCTYSAYVSSIAQLPCEWALAVYPYCPFD